MSPSNGSKIVVSATAGLAVFLNLFIPVSESLSKDTISIISPLIAGTVIFILDWISAKLGWQSAEAMRIRNSVQNQIDSLHEHIARNKKAGLATEELEKALQKAILAQAKQEEAIRKGLSQ